MKIRDNLLTPNKYSRPTTKLLSVRKIVIHFVNNPRTTAQQNRDFFELRKEGLYGYGSAHFIVDDNEIIKCIPENEGAYHVGSKTYTEYGLSISSYPNARTLGIEFCHPDETGKPSYATYKHLIELCKYLCAKYHLDPMKDICTHYDITGVKADGNICPKYYVTNEGQFTRLKLDVNTALNWKL